MLPEDAYTAILDTERALEADWLDAVAAMNVARVEAEAAERCAHPDPAQTSATYRAYVVATGVQMSAWLDLEAYRARNGAALQIAVGMEVMALFAPPLPEPTVGYETRVALCVWVGLLLAVWALHLGGWY